MHGLLRVPFAAAFGLLTATALPLDVTINIVATENCSYGNGKLQAVVTGGVPPYTYAWSNGSTQQIPTMLASGNYTVVVTDSQGAQASANIFLPSGPFLDSDLGVTMQFQGGAYCAASSPAGPWFNFQQPAWFMFAGVAPFTFDGQVGQSWDCDGQLGGYHVWPQGASDGDTIQVAFADANGCPGTINVTLGHAVEWPTMVLGNVQAACGGQDNGSAQVTIGTEGNGQTVWMQLLNPAGIAIMGPDWNYTIGAAPINLTMQGLAPGTYQAVQHIIPDECSPMFGVCTSVFEIVIPQLTDCPCLNPTQFPSSPLMIPTTGLPLTANTCVFFGEYTVFGNIQQGSNYEFTVTGNGYITVREGAANGPVLAQGPSPVTVSTSSAAQLFVHYNANANCGTDNVCRTTTVTRLLDCDMPSATFAPWMDCATGLYHVTVEVTDLGDATGVDIMVLGSAPTYESVGVGSYEMGPFATLDMLQIVVAHDGDSDCTLNAPGLEAVECPVIVVCGDPPLQQDHCYGNSEVGEWTYVADGAGVLNLRFLRGTIESNIFDQLRIYDGQDNTGTLLFEHAMANSANLGPVGSAVLSGAVHQEVNVFASSGALYMQLITDGSVSCASSSTYDPWEWEVLCGTVSITGRAFMDVDMDCTWSSGEVVVPQSIIEVLPGPFYATTNSAGEYFMVLNDGAYTISQINPYVTDHCATSPQPFTVAGNTVTIDFPDTAATALDLAVTMSSGPARVGFNYQQAVAVQNLSARTSGPVTLTVNVDPVIEFTSAVPAPNNINGNTLTWDLPGMQAFQQHSVQVHYQVPVNVGLIATVVATTAMVSNTITEEELANNSTTHLRTITAAYDPNDKLATTSSGASGSSFFIDLDNWIDYNIRFQNTGNDTAFTVVITDTLPSSLDPTTIQIGAASHPFTWELKGPGILEFTFDNILLPDSFVNEPASHGFVGFRIRPHLPVLLGEEITNIANIYFDFNPPVITEPSVLVAEFSTGVAEHQDDHMLQVFPNPADQLLNIVLSGRSELRSMEMRSIDGRLVAAERAQGRAITVQVAHLATGPYSILATDANGRIYRSLFIKQ